MSKYGLVVNAVEVVKEMAISFDDQVVIVKVGEVLVFYPDGTPVVFDKDKFRVYFRRIHPDSTLATFFQGDLIKPSEELKEPVEVGGIGV